MIHYPLRLVVCAHINLDIKNTLAARASRDDLRQSSTSIESNKMFNLHAII